MRIDLTEQIKLITTKEESQLFFDTCTRFAEAATAVSEIYFDGNFQFPKKVCDQDLYYYIRNEFGLKAQMTQSVLRMVRSRYNGLNEQLKQTRVFYRDGKKRYTYHKNLQWLEKPIRFSRPQADLVRNRDWSFRKGKTLLSLNTLESRVVCPFQCRKDSRIFDPEWKLGGGKLVYHPSDKHWYFHVSVSKEFPDVSREEIEQVHGHDRGIINLTTTCDEKEEILYVSGKKVSEVCARYDRTRASLQKKGTKGAKRVLKRLSGRENGFMNDVNHQISKALALKPNTLHALEDLTGISFNNLDNRSSEGRYELRSWSFYDLEQKLSYKAVMNGSMVKKFDPAYTSQRCPKCGNIDKTARDRDKHLYTCPVCHSVFNDDEAAARNIRELGIRYLNGEEDPHYEKN